MRGIPLPGRIPDFKDIGCYALPIGMLKKDVNQLYVENCPTKLAVG